MTENYVIATTKSWNIENAQVLMNNYKDKRFQLITERSELVVDTLKDLSPRYVFFPHWSWIIPREIYDNFNCVVFHMTDLPFGRGGSPLQNLLVRGIYDTKVSAIKVSRGLDTGPVYFKEPINISEGSADEIFRRVSDIIFNKMIPRFMSENLEPLEQEGEAVSFERRTPEQSEIPNGLSQQQIYDYIRMLDGEGYPPAFRQYDKGKVYYTDARIENGMVYARARFVEGID